MSDQTTLDNPVTEPKELPSELSVQDAASALSNLLDDEGNLKEEPQEAEPKAEEQPAEKKAEAKAEAKEEPELVEVDIDGYKVQLPKEKADKLNSERLMQADYTRKTMQAAEARKAAEAEAHKFQQERQAAKQQLDAIATTIEAAVKTGQLKAPDPSLLDSDPVAYLRQKAQWDQANTAYAQAQQQRAALHQQEQQFAQIQRQQILEAERAQLLAKVPEWKDEGKAQTEKAELVNWLIKEQGFTPEQIENTTDHRAMLAQLYAFRYQKLIAEQRAVIDKKVTPASKPVKPGAAQDSPSNPINQAAMQRLRKGGKVDDAAAAIASLLS